MDEARPRRHAANIAINRLFDVDEENDDDIFVQDDDIADESDQSEDDDTDSDVDDVDEESDSESDTNANAQQFTSRDGKLWSSNPSVENVRGRQPRHNILRECGGAIRRVAERAATPFGAFQCFISSEMTNTIVMHTNEEGNRVLHNEWIKTTADELKTYLGLLMLAGVYRGRFEPIINLWSISSGRPIFNKAMPRNRFQQLTRVMRFDSKDDRQERRQRDKMAPLRYIHDKFAALCRANYKPGAHICVDEQLVTYRGRCPFKVYIPSKPGKYGLKVWLCCDVETSYLCNLELYTGRQGHGPEINQATRVVLQMTNHLTGYGRGCTADNFFTTDTLANALLVRQTTFCGTVKQNRRFIPPSLLDIRGRMINSSKFAFFNDTSLVSYIPKKGKNVVLLSTQHHNIEVHHERVDKKPEIILHYNRTKGAVDTLDKLVRTYTCQRKSRRWPMIFFQNIVDMAAYNAFVIFLTVNPTFEQGKTHRRRLFLEVLAMDMISKGITDRQRIQSEPQLPHPRPLLQNDRASSVEQRKRGRCSRCTRETDKKTVDKCSVCNSFICKLHSRLVCNPTCE